VEQEDLSGERREPGRGSRPRTRNRRGKSGEADLEKGRVRLLFLRELKKKRRWEKRRMRTRGSRKDL